MIPISEKQARDMLEKTMIRNHDQCIEEWKISGYIIESINLYEARKDTKEAIENNLHGMIQVDWLKRIVSLYEDAIKDLEENEK